MRRMSIAAITLLLASGALGACKTPRPEDALRLDRESLAQRQLETRRFETDDELMLLRTCLMILQDEGFQMDEMEADLGVLAASTSRVAWYGGRGHRTTHVSLVTHPVAESGGAVAVRVTFYQQVGRGLARLNQPEVFQVFFERLSKAAFLEAQAL